MKKLRDEEGVDLDDAEDDDAGWEGWDVESDSSEESSEGWVDIESDGDDLVVSDSDDEDAAKGHPPEEGTAQVDGADASRISTLATTKVSIPSYFLEKSV